MLLEREAALLHRFTDFLMRVSVLSLLIHVWITFTHYMLSIKCYNTAHPVTEATT